MTSDSHDTNSNKPNPKTGGAIAGGDVASEIHGAEGGAQVIAQCSVLKRMSNRLARVEDAAGLCLAVLAPWVMLWEATLQRVLLGDGDTIVTELPWRLLVADTWLRGSLPLWTPLLYSGSPLAANIQVGAWYPPTLLYGLLPAVAAHNVHELLHLSLAGLGVYLLLRELRAGPGAALVSAITFQCSGFLMYYMPNPGVIATIAWLPVLLWLTQRIAGSGSGACSVGLAVAVYCIITASHLQFTMLAFAVWAGYALVLLFTGQCSGRRRFGRTLALSVSIGVALTAVQMIPTIELFRAGTFAEGLSFARFAEQSLSLDRQLAFALSMRFSSLTDYQGYGEFTFVGYLPLLLATSTLWYARKDPRIAYWWLLGAAGAVLAAGRFTPLARFIYELPFVAVMRLASRQWLFVLVAIVVLAGFGAHRLTAANLAGGVRRPSRYDVIVRGWLAGVSLLAAHTLLFLAERNWVFRRFWAHSGTQPKTKAPFSELLRYLDSVGIDELLIVTAITAGFVASVWALFRWLRQWRGYALPGWVLAAITIFHFHFMNNMWIFKLPPRSLQNTMARMPDLPDNLSLGPLPTTGILGANVDPEAAGRGSAGNERVISVVSHWDTMLRATGKQGKWREIYFSALGPVTNLYAGVPSVSGWGRLSRGDYAKLVGTDWIGIVEDRSVFDLANRILDLLNVRYVLFYDKHHLIRANAFDDAKRYREVSKQADLGTTIYERLSPYGAHWFAEEVRFLPRDQLLAAVRTSRMPDGQPVDMRKVVLLEDSVDRRGIPTAAPTGAAAVTDVVLREPEEICLQVRSDAPRLLVVSEVAYEGWRATIDGHDVPILKPYGILRGIVVPAGASEVVMRYRPASFVWGVSLSLAGCVALALLGVVRRGPRLADSSRQVEPRSLSV